MEFDLETMVAYACYLLLEFNYLSLSAKVVDRGRSRNQHPCTYTFFLHLYLDASLFMIG